MLDVRYCYRIQHGYNSVKERKVLGSEIWQFLIVILGFLIVAVSWLFIVYLPGRTLERWEDQRPGPEGKPASPPNTEPPLEPKG